MAEAHPVGFRWVMKAKEHGATIIHVDPRFSRTSALADIWLPIRAGTDIVFLGGIIRHLIEHNLYFHEYVVHYTNASCILSDEYRDPEDNGDGYFSGGAIGREERLRLIDLMRNTAKDNGRDVTFDVTRWGSKDLTAAQLEAHAADQVTRLVVGPASLDPQVQRDDLTAFAERVGLI